MLLEQIRCLLFAITFFFEKWQKFVEVHLYTEFEFGYFEYTVASVLSKL